MRTMATTAAAGLFELDLQVLAAEGEPIEGAYRRLCLLVRLHVHKSVALSKQCEEEHR